MQCDATAVRLPCLLCFRRATDHLNCYQFAQLHTGDTEDYELVEGELHPLSSGTYRHN